MSTLLPSEFDSEARTLEAYRPLLRVSISRATIALSEKPPADRLAAIVRTLPRPDGLADVKRRRPTVTTRRPAAFVPKSWRGPLPTWTEHPRSSAFGPCGHPYVSASVDAWMTGERTVPVKPVIQPARLSVAAALKDVQRSPIQPQRPARLRLSQVVAVDDFEARRAARSARRAANASRRAA